MTEMAEQGTPLGRVLVKPVFSLPRSIINPNFVLSGREGGRGERTNQRNKTWRMQGWRREGYLYLYLHTRGVAGS